MLSLCPDFILELTEKEEVMQIKPNLHILPKWEVNSVPYLEQLRKKECPTSWSAGLSQSQDVDGQGLGYTSRHSGCNTTIQQFLCCILRRALTSLVLSYKNRLLWLSTKIFSTGLCAANHRWRLVPLSSSQPVVWGGVGQRTEYCDSNKNGGYSNLRLNSRPQGAAFWARRELWRGAWSVLFQLDKNVICHWKWEPGQAMSDHDWWRQNSAIIKSWSRVRPIKNKPTAAHSSGLNLRIWPLADFTIQM